MTFKEMCLLSKEELHQILDMGLMNRSITGYMIDAMKSAGISDSKIVEAVYAIQHSFDMVNANEAEAIYHEFANRPPKLVKRKTGR